MCELKTGDGPRDANRQNAIMVGVVANVAVFIEVHGLRGSQRRFLAKIEGCRFSIRTVIDEKSAATDIAGRRPGNRHGKSCCHGRIDCVAALFHNFNADFGGDHRGRGHHAVVTPDRMPAGVGAGNCTDEKQRRDDGDEEFSSVALIQN